MAKIIYNGKEEEAYSLPILKEFAQQIVAGEKTIEVRRWCEHYCRQFIDKEIWKKNEQLVAEGRGDECEPVIKDIFAIHFYDKSHKAFEVDVILDDLGIAAMSKEDIKFLAETYNYHDQDNKWQQFETLKDDEKPHFFWFHIAKVIQHKGL